MPHWNIDDPIDDPRVPDSLRLKAQKLARERIDGARERVIAQAQRMTPKKAARLTADQASRAAEKARQRLARQKQFKTSAEPSFNRPSLVGEQSAYYATETPENRARFTPRRGYVEIPASLKEGVRQDLVEKYAIPDDQADALASNAVDRWAQLTRRENKASLPAPSVQESFTPQFLVHPFSDVQYPDEDMAQGMGGYSPEQVRQRIRRLRSNRTLGGIDWGQVNVLDSLLPAVITPEKVDPTVEVEWAPYYYNVSGGGFPEELRAQRVWLPKGQPGPDAGSRSGWVKTGNTRAAGSDQPSGGSLDAQDQVIPITPSDPTTKEPLEPTAVDIAKAQVAEARAVSKSSIVPLAIGAGVLIYLLARR